MEKIEIEPDVAPTAVSRPDLGASVVGLRAAARRHAMPSSAWPYLDEVTDPVAHPSGHSAGPAIEVDAIPYYWANRTPGAMRVWIPRGPARP